MKLLYIGSGFVGACSAAVSADSGHETLVCMRESVVIALIV